MAKRKCVAEIRPTRREFLRGTSAALLGVPAFPQQFASPPHPKGPRVFLDYDQVELDAAYDQTVYEPNLNQIKDRFVSNSAAVRARIGDPQRVAYGTSEIEKLDIYKAKRDGAPI